MWLVCRHSRREGGNLHGHPEQWKQLHPTFGMFHSAVFVWKCRAAYFSLMRPVVFSASSRNWVGSDQAQTEKKLWRFYSALLFNSPHFTRSTFNIKRSCLEFTCSENCKKLQLRSLTRKSLMCLALHCNLLLLRSSEQTFQLLLLPNNFHPLSGEPYHQSSKFCVWKWTHPAMPSNLSSSFLPESLAWHCSKLADLFNSALLKDLFLFCSSMGSGRVTNSYKP